VRSIVDAPHVGSASGWVNKVRSRRNRNGCGFCHVFYDAEGTTRGPEAHLKLAVNGQQPNLIGYVGQEEDGDITFCDIRKVGVELRAETQIVGSEVELARDQELSLER
jgi:hypothetical protein